MLSLAAGDSSESSWRSRGNAFSSFFTGIMYSASPSSATCTSVGEENLPPVDIFRVVPVLLLSSPPVSARNLISTGSAKMLRTLLMADRAAEVIPEVFTFSDRGCFTSAVKAS